MGASRNSFQSIEIAPAAADENATRAAAVASEVVLKNNPKVGFAVRLASTIGGPARPAYTQSMKIKAGV